LREAESIVDRVAGEVAIGGALEPLVARVDEGPREPVSPGDLRKGQRVWVPRLRAEAQVIEVAGEQVRVAAGPLKLTVAASELRIAQQPEPAPSRPALRAVPGRSKQALDVAPEQPPIPTRDNTCDLRGLRVDDAVAMATTFLDRALGAGERTVFLRHGQGTGALRDAIRNELARSTYVARFGAANPDQGGEGVTVVWLA
jgi:DNA mismatch repair protein MutS2